MPSRREITGIHKLAVQLQLVCDNHQEQVPKNYRELWTYQVTISDNCLCGGREGGRGLAGLGAICHDRSLHKPTV